MRKSIGLTQPAMYQIRVRGVLDARWAASFEGMTMTAMGDETIITGHVADQSALHGLLTKIRDLGLPLMAVNQMPAFILPGLPPNNAPLLAFMLGAMALNFFMVWIFNHTHGSLVMPFLAHWAFNFTGSASGV